MDLQNKEKLEILLSWLKSAVLANTYALEKAGLVEEGTMDFLNDTLEKMLNEDR